MPLPQLDFPAIVINAYTVQDGPAPHQRLTSSPINSCSVTREQPTSQEPITAITPTQTTVRSLLGKLQALIQSVHAGNNANEYEMNINRVVLDELSARG